MQKEMMEVREMNTSEFRTVMLFAVMFAAAFAAVGMYWVHENAENQPVMFTVKITYTEPRNVTVPLPEGELQESDVKSLEITIRAPRGYMEEL